MDVIATVACGYGWSHIRTFALSVARSGFTGRKIIFTADCDKDIANAEQLGFDLIPFERGGDVTVQRHDLFAEWIAQHPETRFAMLLDSRDLVVQSDPSVWLAQHARMRDALIFAASECVPIGHEQTNGKWIRSLYGTGAWMELMPHDILCAGSLIGEAQAVRGLASAIWRECQRLPQWGSDQAALNYLARKDFAGIVRIPRNAEGLILTCSWIANTEDNTVKFRQYHTDQEPDFRDGVAYPKGSQVPFCILHQYDRDPVKREAVIARYQ